MNAQDIASQSNLLKNNTENLQVERQRIDNVESELNNLEKSVQKEQPEIKIHTIDKKVSDVSKENQPDGALETSISRNKPTEHLDVQSKPLSLVKEHHAPSKRMSEVDSFSSPEESPSPSKHIAAIQKGEDLGLGILRTIPDKPPPPYVPPVPVKPEKLVPPKVLHDAIEKTLKHSAERKNNFTRSIMVIVM